MSETKDTNAGLVGPIVITRKGYTTGSKNLSPKDVDHERFLLFTTFDERKSRYATKNILKLLHTLEGGSSLATSNTKDAAVRHLKLHPSFRRSSLKHSVNGKAVCDLSGVGDGFKSGETVRWNLLVLGDEIDLHTPTFEGSGLVNNGRRVDAVPLMPGNMRSVDMVLREGKWAIFDAPSEHYDGGAMLQYEVSAGSGGSQTLSGADNPVTYTHYIAADEVEWDYVPEGKNLCDDRDFSASESAYTKQGLHRIGNKYMKALYREYRDEAFANLRRGGSSRYNEASAHLGLLGPILKAEVGDTLVIIFRNNLRAPASLTPLGGGLSGIAKVEAHNEVQRRFRSLSAVTPGGEVKITLKNIPKDAGPSSSASENSVAHIYASDVDLTADVNAGLIGVIIVYEDKAKGAHGLPSGIDREFVALFNTFDENLSRYAKLNALKYADDGQNINVYDPDYRESNMMHSINGYLHCNAPSAKTYVGRSSRWYFLSLGKADGGVHGPRTYGHTFTSNDRSQQSVFLLPGSATSADLVSHSAGRWILKDEVGEHYGKGASMFLQIRHPI